MDPTVVPNIVPAYNRPCLKGVEGKTQPVKLLKGRIFQALLYTKKQILNNTIEIKKKLVV